MIVQCDKCQTKYRIADEKVTGKGVKVRCAKCENVFIVKPSAPPEAPVPTPTPLDSPAPAHTPATRTIPSQIDPPPDSTGDKTAPIPTGGPGPSPTPLDFTPPQSPPEDKVPSAPVDSPEYAVPAEDQAPPSQPEIPGSSFEDSVFSDEPMGRAESLFPHPDQLSITGSSTSDPSAPAPMDGGDADMDWGNIPLDAEDDSGSGRSDVDLAPTPDPSLGPDPFGPSVPAPSPEQEFPFQPPETEPTRVVPRQGAARPAEKGSKGLVFFLVLVLLGAGGYFAYPKIRPLIGKVTGRIPAVKSDTLIVKDSRFGSIKRSDGITLVTVRGVVTNNTGKKQGMIRVTGEFKGAGGKILAESASFCGNIFSDDDLNLMPMGKIRSALENELGQSLSNSAVAPGKSVPFLLVLENPPVGKIKEVTFKIENGLGNN